MTLQGANNPPTLQDLRREVLRRLRAFNEEFDVSEIDLELNRQLDIWSRDAEIIQMPIIQDITANSNPQILVPNPGYQVVRVLAVKIRQSGQDVGPIDLYTARQADMTIPDWRNSNTTASIPIAGILDFNATVAGKPATPRSLWLYPWPSTALTGGLVVDHVAATFNLLQQDLDVLPAQAYVVMDFLIEKTCEQVLMRVKDSEGAAYHGAEARRESRSVRRRNASERSTDRSSTVYWV